MSVDIDQKNVVLSHGPDDGFFIVDESEVIASQTQENLSLAKQEFQELDPQLAEVIDYKSLYLKSIDIMNQSKVDLSNHQQKLSQTELELNQIKMEFSQTELELNQTKLELSSAKVDNKKLNKLAHQLGEKCLKHEQHIAALGQVSQLDAHKIKETLIELEVVKSKAENEKKQAVEQIRSEMKVEINRIITEAETKLNQFELEIRTQYQPKRTPQSDNQFEKLKQDLHLSQVQNSDINKQLKTMSINAEYMQLQLDDYKQCLESSKNDNETLNEIIALLKSDSN